MNWYKFTKYFLIALTFIALSGCASDKTEAKKETAESLYNEGINLYEQKKYEKSAEKFEKIELEYPYSKLAVKAKLKGAEAYYNDEKYDDALLALDRFIKFHPGNRDIAYAYYLKAMCYFNQVSDVEKEQENSALALDALEQVIKRFPNTQYGKEAQEKLQFVKEHLAGKEMEVGRFYLQRKNYLAALGRFSEVVNKYRRTNHAEEALYRQVELYQILGLNSEAEVAYKILIYNYPKGNWSSKAAKIMEK